MKNKLSWFAVPYVGWMAIFCGGALILVVVYAFTTADGGFTLDNFARMGTYSPVFTRSVSWPSSPHWSASSSATPGPTFLAKEGPQVQRMAMVLIMLPMWMNFLLRTYSWMSILERQRLFQPAFSQSACSALSTSSSAPISTSST